MKKHFKKTLSFILSLMMIMSMFAGLEISSFAENDILSYLTYEIKDGEVTITNCDESISGDIVIPDTIEGYPVTVIGTKSFDFCSNLNSLIIPDSVTKIDSWAISYCFNLESVYIPDSVKEIGAWAFAYCPKLTKANLPKGITSIKERTFYMCEKLGNLEIPEGVKDIEFLAFAGCKNLTSITIPKSTTSIIKSAFFDCKLLTDITVLNSDIEIGEYALGFCENGLGILVDGAVIYGYADSTAETYAKENGITFNAIETEEPPVEEPPVKDDILNYLTYEINNGEVTITDCDESISGDVVIPDTIEGYPVRVIKNGAFMNCKKLVSVAIGDNVTVLNEGSFAECDNLESVTFGNSVKEIGYCAFGYCDKLDNIILPDSLVKIGNTAFLACTSLNNIKINDGVESIGMHAFSGCTSLTKLIIPTSVNNISFFAFGYTDFSNGTETMLRDDGCTIYGVPGSAAEAYANENGIAFIAIEPEEPPVEEPPVEEPPVEEPPVEEPPVEEPPVKEPPVEEPPVEEPTDDGKLDVKVESEIAIDFEKNIVQISKEVSHEALASMITNERFGVFDKNIEALGDADLVGTGSKILILDKDGNIANEYTVVVPTDIDGNGKTTAADARLALRNSAQLENLEGVYFEAADVTGDGKITASDARKILRIAANLEK